MHIIAARAVCFGEALKPEFEEYSKNVIQLCSRYPIYDEAF